ncbi:hypothetical protein Hanom_Chr12g01092791 [Helianthus anomalus]
MHTSDSSRMSRRIFLASAESTPDSSESERTRFLELKYCIVEGYFGNMGVGDKGCL